MFELTIKDTVYQFKFGMGFMREINKKHSAEVEGWKNVEQNVGLQYHVANVIGYDCESLVEILDCANKGRLPRVKRDLLDDYIDECEDIDALFDEVIGFLKQENATKKVTARFLEAAAEQAKAK